MQTACKLEPLRISNGRFEETLLRTWFIPKSVLFIFLASYIRGRDFKFLDEDAPLTIKIFCENSYGDSKIYSWIYDNVENA